MMLANLVHFKRKHSPWRCFLFFLVLCLLPIPIRPQLPPPTFYTYIHDVNPLNRNFFHIWNQPYGVQGAVETTLINNEMTFIPPSVRAAGSLTINAPNGNKYPGITHVNEYGSQYFLDYFRDVPGNNIPLILPLTGATQQNGFYYYNLCPATNQSLDYYFGRTYNMNSASSAMTLSLRIPWSYQGGEVFSASSIDDLRVFLDNVLVCDNGGLHPAATCNIRADDYNWNTNTLHNISLFYSQRRYAGCLQFSTNIHPTNMVPVVQNSYYYVKESDGPQYISLYNQIADMDGPDSALQYTIVAPTSTKGIVTLDGVTQFFGSQPITTGFYYTPITGYTGTDYIYFVATDGIGNSATGTVIIQIQSAAFPPTLVPFGIYNVQINTMIEIDITALSSSSAVLSYIPDTASKFGAYTIQTNGTVASLIYSATAVGSDTIQYFVTDGPLWVRGNVTITVVNSMFSSNAQFLASVASGRAGIPRGNLIIIIVACIIGGIVFVTFLDFAHYKFFKLASDRETWKYEWTSQMVRDNPLMAGQIQSKFDPFGNADARYHTWGKK